MIWLLVSGMMCPLERRRATGLTGEALNSPRNRLFYDINPWFALNQRYKYIPKLGTLFLWLMAPE